MNAYDALIRSALDEDCAFEDATALACIAKEQAGTAQLVAKASGVLSGCSVATSSFHQLDEGIQAHWFYHDGDAVQTGDVIATFTGSLRSLLAAERTALNFLQHLSGIASATRQLVNAVADTACRITDTRKTTPGMRTLEKQAVLHGGGTNHRMHLAAAMLIKENHIAAAGSITDAVHACYSHDSNGFIEVECETLEQVAEAVAVAPDMILLDNMPVDVVLQARKLVPDSILLEASGNITLHNAAAYAATGVNRLAIGAITHSAPVLDLSLRVRACD